MYWFAGAQLTQASIFGPPVPYPVGPLPCYVHLGDFNNDGILDIVVGNKAGGIRALLGNGDGTFQASILTRTPHPSHGAACAPWAVADFNRDGNLDLLVAYTTGQIQVLLGNGDGTFKLIGEGSKFSMQAASADFNEDGIPDLALVRVHGFCGALVLLGNGDATFRKGSQIFVGQGCLVAGGPYAVSDFNSDGHQDLLMVGVGEGTIIDYYVAFGNGDGTFQSPLVTSTQNNAAGDFVVADLNGDGIADLAQASYSQGDVGVQLGAGDGTFPYTFPTYCYTTYPTSYLRLADFNGDSVLDAAFITYSGGGLFVGPGHSDGSFGPCSLVDAGPSPGPFAIGDFNQDGVPDLAVPNYQPNGTVSVLLNTQVAAPGRSRALTDTVRSQHTTAPK
jgi:hypothetical protein